MRVIVRRRKLAPGEQPTVFAFDRYKFSVFITNTTGLPYNCWLGHLPSHAWTVNLAWCTVVSVAMVASWLIDSH